MIGGICVSIIPASICCIDNKHNVTIIDLKKNCFIFVLNIYIKQLNRTSTMTHTTFPRTTACWTIRNDCMSIGIIRTRFLLAHSTTSSTSSRSTTTRAIISRRATTSYIATIIKAIQRTAILGTLISPAPLQATQVIWPFPPQ